MEETVRVVGVNAKWGGPWNDGGVNSASATSGARSGRQRAIRGQRVHGTIGPGTPGRGPRSSDAETSAKDEKKLASHDRPSDQEEC
jgi:hypothetical protein